jgi:23S rRNA pseudouridine1911/1915/1917 synthase
MVECTLETGRTHQIRIHLSELGHPVCGDKVYAAPDDAADSSRAPRLALHAAALSFTHPSSGKRMDFQMPLPSDLDEFWNRLRRGK